MKPQYLFGDDDTAARRLQLLAQVFAESTRSFLRNTAGGRIPLALDLGCGPGFTTHLIAETLECDRVVGLETSPRFLEIARSTAAASIGFAPHDVLALPLPEAPADLIFCRFLLTHLEDPAGAIGQWATQLRPHGRLMAEEVETIRTAHPVFSPYIRMVEALLASQRNFLYAGPIIAALEVPGGTELAGSALRPVAVRNCDAARMFGLNLRVWKNDEFARTYYSSESIRELESALEGIAQGESDASEIQWEMRQVVFRRSGAGG
jgi:trans-aconitate 2-methyltransferase